MSEGVLIALISAGSALLVGALSLVGVVISNKKYGKDIEHKLQIAQAVTDTKIEELTREVREHNGFARRMPVVEEKIEHLIETEDHMQEEIDHLRTFHEK